MTNNIYPPDHLLRKWEELIIDEGENVDVVLYEAFQAGADQELEACCEWLKVKEWIHPEFSDELRAARRPKPLSLKEQAKQALGRFFANEHTQASQMTRDFEIIRRALESLPN